MAATVARSQVDAAYGTIGIPTSTSANVIASQTWFPTAAMVQQIQRQDREHHEAMLWNASREREAERLREAARKRDEALFLALEARRAAVFPNGGRFLEPMREPLSRPVPIPAPVLLPTPPCQTFTLPTQTAEQRQAIRARGERTAFSQSFWPAAFPRAPMAVAGPSAPVYAEDVDMGGDEPSVGQQGVPFEQASIVMQGAAEVQFSGPSTAEDVDMDGEVHDPTGGWANTIPIVPEVPAPKGRARRQAFRIPYC
jgi:hypothetical protein